MKKKAFTLGEVIVTVIIISILASIAMGNYYVTTVRAREREEQALLRLIQHAEEVRVVELNNYATCNSTVNCNTTLRLNLPTTSWTYTVPNAATSVSFCAQAVLAGHNSYHINQGSAGPCASDCGAGACP